MSEQQYLIAQAASGVDAPRHHTANVIENKDQRRKNVQWNKAQIEPEGIVYMIACVRRHVSCTPLRAECTSVC